MSKLGTTVVYAFVAVAGIGAAGYGKWIASTAGAADTHGSATGAAPAKLDGETAVLDLYVHCFNEVDHRVTDSFGSYAKWVDLKKGLTGKEPSLDGISPPDDYHTGKCLANLQQASANVAPGALADATRAYQTALGALLPIEGSVKTYYEHKDYKDDAFAKGKQLHAQLVTAYEAWDKADDAMRTAWDARHRAQRDAHLADLEKAQGRKSELFVTAQIMNTGEALVETFGSDAKPDALLAAIAKYQAAYDELDAFFGPALTASTDTDRYMFKEEAEHVLVQTKEAARTLKAKKPLPETGDGSATELMKKYNNLVERSNSITWD